MSDYWIDHIHLMSHDPVKTGEFYQKMFGAKHISTRDRGNGRMAVNIVLNGATILIGQPATDDAPTGLVHFGIGTKNLENVVDGLKSEGVKFTEDVREIRPGFKISFLEAPEGVTIELQEGKA